MDAEVRGELNRIEDQSREDRRDVWRAINSLTESVAGVTKGLELLRQTVDSNTRPCPQLIMLTEQVNRLEGLIENHVTDAEQNARDWRTALIDHGVGILRTVIVAGAGAAGLYILGGG